MRVDQASRGAYPADFLPGSAMRAHSARHHPGLFLSVPLPLQPERRLRASLNLAHSDSNRYPGPTHCKAVKAVCNVKEMFDKRFESVCGWKRRIEALNMAPVPAISPLMHRLSTDLSHDWDSPFGYSFFRQRKEEGAKLCRAGPRCLPSSVGMTPKPTHLRFATPLYRIRYRRP